MSAALSFPAVLGFNFAGVIEATPYAAHPLQPGDRVYGMAKVPRGDGSYAELVAATSLSVAPMPVSLDFVQAAAVPLAALTAWGAVVDTAAACTKSSGTRMGATLRTVAATSSP